jgi:hypothetical protein
MHKNAKEVPTQRRSFIKGILAGSLALAGLKAGAKRADAATGPDSRRGTDEILYRETEEFTKYYQSLRD